MVVVQWLERLTVDQEAAGSNPVNHPSPVGGIGRHGRSRACCPSWRGSSSLSPGTLANRVCPLVRGSATGPTLAQCAHWSDAAERIPRSWGTRCARTGNSVGRVPLLQRGSRRFDPVLVHFASLVTVAARILGKDEVPGQYRGEAPARLAELAYAARLECAAGRHGSSSLLPGTCLFYPDSAFRAGEWTAARGTGWPL